VERTLPDPAGGPPVVLRLSIEVDAASLEGTGAEALKGEVEKLRAALDVLASALPGGAHVAARPDRPLEELVQTYRPRQPELLELLRDEGELTPSEFDLLRRHLASPPPPPPAPVPITERPIAAAPLEADHAPTTARPVEELLRVYNLASLKQAGAVRARRQISFEEYMSLKRHFGAADAPR